MKDLDTMYTDATCYESEMRYPTDPKLLWEGRGKEVKGVEFGAKCSNILADGLSFIEKLSFNAFNEWIRLPRSLKMHGRLFGVEAKKGEGDAGYAGNADRELCR